MVSVESGLKVSGSAIAINVSLAIIKITTGLLGHSYALVADGIESTADIFSSLIVWGSLRISAKPPDHDHPYGHGKAESLAGAIVAMFLVGAAILIAVQSIREILTPHQTPAWYTLVVLVAIIITKELLFRRMFRVGQELDSSALKSDAWHHRSDALTSIAAFVGISIALIGGPGYEVADDWAALLACSVIFYNGFRLLRPALDEVMDAAVPEETEQQIRALASQVEGVIDIEKCRVRKSGLGLMMDIHVVVDGEISVRRGHQIAHDVKDRLVGSSLSILDVILHIEPDNLGEIAPLEPEGHIHQTD
ncbi:MAG: cation transporter [Anaerolineales bacterium]|nr:cation transporter [Anaerolineales bacterium]